MKATQLIAKSLAGTRGWAMGLIMDLKDAPLAQPTSAGGNHALWILGHLIYSESALFDTFVMGRPNRYPEWEKVFGMKTIPTANAADYPSFEQVLPKFDEIRADVLAHLVTLSEDDLDARSHAPEEFGEGFLTVGSCYMAMSTHVAFHAGQVADCRRSLGRDPLNG